MKVDAPMDSYAARLASFNATLTSKKKRSSDSKGAKILKWPHQTPSPPQLAKAGFFYKPTATNPDNATCYLCLCNLDGWEEDDEPVEEHLKHSPSCGYALIASIERAVESGEQNSEDPMSKKLVEARAMTFRSTWPHESKRGWMCKSQKMAEAGWHYCPTLESDDFVKCAYCNLSLDGWEPKDNPYDEHQRRSPDCMFFTLSASSQSIRAQKGRPSKASRMSTKSNCTLVPDEPSVMDTSPHDSSMVSIPSSAKTTRSGKVAKKAKKAKAQSVLPKSEDTQLASSFIEAEDDDFEIKVVKPVVTKAKGKKRNSEDIAGAAEISSTTMPKKRRTTRTRNSVASVQAVAEVISETTKLELDQGGRMTDTDELSQQSNPATKKRGKKDNKRGSSTSRKASSKSIASEASLRAGMPNDEEIDAALERELDRPLTDDGEDDEEEICKPTKGRRLTRTKPGLKATAASTAPTRRTTRTSTITIDDSLAEPYSAIPVAMESEKQMPDDVGKPLAKTVPVAKASKKTSTRKASAKQNGMDHAGEAVEELPAHADEQLEGTKQKQTRGRKPSYQVHTHGGHLLDPPVLSTGGVTISKSNGYAIDSSVKEDDSCHETDANTVGLTKRGKKASVAESTQRDKEAGPRAHVFEATVQSAMPDTIVEPGEAAVTPADGIDDLGSAAEESNRLTKKQRKSLEAGSAMMGRNAASKPLKGEEGAVDARTSEPAVREVEPSSPPATSIHSTPRPVPSPQSSDAENQPPSSRPSQSRPPLSFESPIKSQELRIPLAVITTPSASPSKGKFMKIQSSFPWTAMDIDQVFNGTPDAEKENQPFAIGANLLTSPEKKLTVEEWIKFKAQRGEERLRNDCERLVGRFEDQGVRALRTLEGIICVD